MLPVGYDGGMIRKAVIVVLTLATAVTGVPAFLSCVGMPSVWETPTVYPGSRGGFLQGSLYIELSRVLDPRQPESRKVWSWSVGCDEFYEVIIGCHKFRYGTEVVNWQDAKSLRQTLVQIVVFPFFLLFAAYPTIVFIRGPLRRRRRHRKGLCVTCGYNLTGLTEPRCPECGTKV